MKKTLKGILIAVIAVSLVFSLVSCGGGDSPKALAKQVNELFPKARDGDEAATNKIAEINEKLKAFSEEQIKEYNDELMRLMGMGN